MDRAEHSARIQIEIREEQMNAKSVIWEDQQRKQLQLVEASAMADLQRKAEHVSWTENMIERKYLEENKSSIYLRAQQRSELAMTQSDYAEQTANLKKMAESHHQSILDEMRQKAIHVDANNKEELGRLRNELSEIRDHYDQKY
jgi:hypothetical protein